MLICSIETLLSERSVPETCESKGRLSTSAVLLGQVDGELVEHLTGVALQRPEQGSVTVHHDESEPIRRESCYIELLMEYPFPYLTHFKNV